MAKKSNRPKSKPAARPAAQPEVIESEPAEAPPPAAEPRVARAPKLSRSQAAAERIEDEYGFIVGDLRRVFLLALAMFALLIILNIVLSLT